MLGRGSGREGQGAAMGGVPTLPCPQGWGRHLGQGGFGHWRFSSALNVPIFWCFGGLFFPPLPQEDEEDLLSQEFHLSWLFCLAERGHKASL